MKTRSYLLLKMIFIFIAIFGILYILEYGFTLDSPYKLLNSLLLSILATVIFFNAGLKRYALIFSFACLMVMVLTYIINWPDLFIPVGNFGFSLLVITVFLYLPQIIKNGHVEKF